MFKGLVTRVVAFASILSNLIFCISPARAQQSKYEADTSFLTLAVNHAEQVYHSSLKAQSNLNNGSDYAEYNALQDEHPYFLNDDWQFGILIYDNDRFEDVPLLYDISQQKLVTEHFSTANKIALISKKISLFTLGSHTFVRIEKAGASAAMSEGFYDLLFDGRIKVLAKREKQLQERVLSGELEATFEEINRYYIHKDKNFFPVKSKRSVINVLADQKRSMKEFARKHKINFRLHREDALVSVAKFYDSLKNQ